MTDKSGTILRQQKYKTGAKQATVNISSLHTDVYLVRLWNGKEWSSVEVIKK